MGQIRVGQYKICHLLTRRDCVFFFASRMRLLNMHPVPRLSRSSMQRAPIDFCWQDILERARFRGHHSVVYTCPPPDHDVTASLLVHGSILIPASARMVRAGSPAVSPWTRPCLTRRRDALHVRTDAPSILNRCPGRASLSSGQSQFFTG